VSPAGRSALLRRRLGPARSRGPREPTAPMEFPPLEEMLGGVEIRSGHGCFWEIETPLVLPGASIRIDNALRSNQLHAKERDELDGGEPLGVEEAVFFDLETCGFSGTPLFLVGILVAGGDGSGDDAGAGGGSIRISQFLARDYSEEAAVVAAAAARLGRRPLWISFNGRAYDRPFLAERAIRHGLRLPAPRAHLDLLHAARRRWRNRLPDCRLGTLEARILGRPRIGDVPGAEAPERYHRFVRTGDARSLAPVIRHNLMDLTALVELLGTLPETGYGESAGLDKESSARLGFVSG